ncbi:pseudouridine synthase [Nitrospira sp.]|nr:pseudouridine synthase [Nitrospira sp.]
MTTFRNQPGAIRINKFFTEHGLASRRGADRLIEEGRVTINGRRAVLGDVVSPNDCVTLDGRSVAWGHERIYIKYHKPIGITTTTELEVEGNIITTINHPSRIFPVGRLDKDSSGLIFLTNDGDLVNEILRAEFGHEREYRVQVDRPFNQAFLDRMAAGVTVLGRPTLACKVWAAEKRCFHIVLTEGRNRQIRRMCEALGYRVTALQRIRIMHVTLDDLPVGTWKDLSQAEREKLLHAVGRTSGWEAG